MARIAFIGLGNMGGGMAANLAKAGHDVARLRSQRGRPRPRRGARLPAAPASAAEAVQGAEAVVTMLPAGKHVRDVYADERDRRRPRPARS